MGVQAGSRNNYFALIPFCVAMLITMSKKQLGGEQICLAYNIETIMDGSHGRNSLGTGAKMMKECCPLAYSPRPAQLVFFFLIHLKTTWLERVALPKMGCILPQQPLIKKMPTRRAQRLIWWGQFLNWGSLLPGGSSLYQVDKN